MNRTTKNIKKCDVFTPDSISNIMNSHLTKGVHC